MWKYNPPTSNPEAAAIAKTNEDWHLNNNNSPKIKPYDTTNTNRLISPSKEDLQKDFYKSQLIAPIKPEDVKLFIRQLKKSPGKSGIPNKMLKKLPNSYIIHLTKIYNAALSLGYFPDSFIQLTSYCYNETKKGNKTLITL